MDLETAAAKLYGLLELNRKAVGVKLVHSEAEYQQYSATELLRPLPYCVAVKKRDGREKHQTGGGDFRV